MKGGDTGLSRRPLIVTDLLESVPPQMAHSCLLLPLLEELRPPLVSGMGKEGSTELMLLRRQQGCGPRREGPMGTPAAPLSSNPSEHGQPWLWASDTGPGGEVLVLWLQMLVFLFIVSYYPLPVPAPA